MRDLFLLDPDIRFLNHGSFGACPAEVFDTFQRWQRELERNPVEFLGRRSGPLLAQAREALAAYLHAPAADLAFVPNATVGVNLVARSLALQPGDEVLGTDLEYGACDATWREVCAQHRADYRRIEIPLPFERETFVERICDAVTARTRLIFASHITSTTALRLPIEDLCEAAREMGVPTLIDGAHAPGQLPLDLDAMEADYYVGNLHKWLCAPKGAAFVHVRPQHHRQLVAPVISWGYVAGADGAPEDLPESPMDKVVGRSALQRRLQWQGTRDLAAFLSVPAAIDFQARHDWPAQRARCHALVIDTMHRVLARNGLAAIARDDDFVQMAAIPVRSTDAQALQRQLFDDHRIEVPVTQHRETTMVRISAQAYTTDDEAQALVDALASIGV
jgi:isopenicillin-N epimerase